MKLSIVDLVSVKNTYFFCLILLYLSHGVRTQNHFSNTGLPLPILKEGHLQGQPAIPSADSVRGKNGVPGAGSPIFIKIDGDDPTIANPNLGIGLDPQKFPSQINRKTASGPGFLQRVDNPGEDVDVRSLLRHPEVLKKLQTKSDADSAIKIHSVIAAHKQIVSGTMTFLDVKVVETLCPVGTRDLSTCQVDATEEPIICEIAVWQRPWLNSTKIVDEKTKCSEVEKDNDFVNWAKGRDHLQNRVGFTVLQSLPPYLDESQVALEGFEYINRGSESKFKGQMINYHISKVLFNLQSNVTLIDIDVEYGFTLCLKFPNKKVDDRICPLDTIRANYVCRVTVLSNPTLTTNLKVLPGDDDDIDCKKKGNIGELVVSIKAVCMGCPKSISLNDPSVLKVTEFALVEHDRRSDDRELHQLVKLHKAQTQVVNGLKYYITMELAETECRKPLSAVNIDRNLCKRLLNEETDVCDVVVHEKPWQGVYELISSKCYDRHEYPVHRRDDLIVPAVGKSNFQSRIGVSTPQTFGLGLRSPTVRSSPAAFSSSIQDSIALILNEVNRREVDDYDDGLYKVIKVIESTTRNEISGPVDHITLELGETVCTRQNPAIANCPLKIGEDGEVCSASVLRGPPRRLMQLDCDDTDDYYRLTANPRVVPFHPASRPFFFGPSTRTGTVESPIQQPTNDSTVELITRFIVDQYNLQNDEDEFYKLSNIVNSYSQVSSEGTLYIVELELVETICKKYQPVVDVSNCPAERFERPEICQAEVIISHSGGGRTRGTKRLNRIFCDERRGFYIKKIKRKFGNVASPSRDAAWVAENVTDGKMKRFGRLIADEFDFRSDDDNIFVLVKIINSASSGLSHRMHVELAETVCPKYKRNIDKNRCAIDIGEEHKFCDALVEERPWEHGERVTQLKCKERDASREVDESDEVFYARVRPSAHSRPRFPQSQYRIRQHSRESDESNEKYYRNPSGSVIRRDSDEGGIDHDDIGFQHPHHAYDRDDEDDERDSDHLVDSRSIEGFYPHYRDKRTVGLRSPTFLDNEVQELAALALSELNKSNGTKYKKKVLKIIKFTKKVTTESYTLKFSAVETICGSESVGDAQLCAARKGRTPIHCAAEISKKAGTKVVESVRCV